MFTKVLFNDTNGLTMSDLIKQTMSVIKNRAKVIGITQKDLAKNLNVSLPTIKRWYAGGTISLDILKQLCDEVDITITDIFSSIEEKDSPHFTYTNEQELFFAGHPDYLAFFDYLLRGHSSQYIQKRFSLSDKKVIQILSKLDKLRLLDWLPKNKVKILVFGQPIWRKDGPLAMELRGKIFDSFIQNEIKSKSHFFLHDYLPEDALAIQVKINELIQMANNANRKAKNKPTEVKSFGFYISIQDFRWNLDKFLED